MRVTKRKPPLPGTILREEFLEPYGITQETLAKAMGVTRTVVNELVNGRRSITVDTAFMLSGVFGTSPEFWLNMQLHTDMWEAVNHPKKQLKFKKVMSLKEILKKQKAA